ncbi:MAG: Large conductance mechanosensitive channel protein [Parcubacteria group bacterium GW2011_GWA2_51_10]|nr:MAG: Large conductance mechanosensitive channel protein [Parcubacteria group bacterium GW2011_GWA2_51_10]
MSLIVANCREYGPMLHVRDILNNFKKFILRGNVLDLAVGVMMGSAFTAVVNALVKDLMTPIVGAIVKTPNLSELTLTIRGSTIMYGDFVSALVSFLIIAASIYFFVIIPMNMFVERIRGPQEPNPTTKKCPECKSEIPIDATRCAHCAIQLP